MKTIGKITLTAILLSIVYLLFWPIDINPVIWKSQKATSTYSNNTDTYLKNTQIFGKNDGIGPEDIDVDSEGNIYAPYEDGRIMRYDVNAKNPKLFADTKGRPLGLEFDKQGNLIVCDAKKGLLKISKDGIIEVLLTSVDGIDLGFTNDVDISKDGTIYFTDASSKWHIEDYRSDIIEHIPYGRLISYNLKTKESKVLKDDLYFANGVAISSDQSFVLINETSEYRIIKVWISGKNKGKSEIFMDNLEGIPDGISSNSKGIFWIAFPSKRKDILDNLANKPFLRKVIMRLPQFLQPSPERHAFVLGVNENAKIVYNLHDSSKESFSPITSVEEHKGKLYLGSLSYPGFGVVKIPTK
jgi:sugar lactone lactonase YvrE